MNGNFETKEAESFLYDQLLSLLNKHFCSLYLTGLSGVGKTTLGIYISDRLKIPYLDVGVGYRLATFLLNSISVGVDNYLNNILAVSELLSVYSLNVTNGRIIIVNKSNNEVFPIEEILFNKEINSSVPLVAAMPAVRNSVNEFFNKELVAPLVITGRNTIERVASGKIVEVKIAVDIVERARRLARKNGTEVAFERALLEQRDQLDQNSMAKISSIEDINLTSYNIEQSAEKVIVKAIDLCETNQFGWTE